MSRTKGEKIKLLKLYEILCNDTDENHPLTTSELCGKLAQEEIECERRTLSEDVKCLNGHGYEIMSAQKGHNKSYYVADRKFDKYELRILIDAVRAANFIPPDKTEEFAGKIAALGGSHCAKELSSHAVVFNTHKHSNREIFYTVYAIDRALNEGKRINFLYFHLDENLSRVYRHDKTTYTVDPLALVYNDDNYYLVAYDPDTESKRKNFRLDRMEKTEISDEPVCEHAKNVLLGGDVLEYVRTQVRMYSGEEKTVVLEFPDDKADIVYDEFGENVSVTRLGDGVLAASVTVQLSPTFFGWLAQSGGTIRISSPAEAREKYRAHLAACAENI